ncbi:hypothetical protein AN958_01090 [Leucoagaricus sp. SymC.cos]|nr:hypothetical protein AN958_01090 [Leucoagaricus sp. SymC.cos]
MLKAACSTEVTHSRTSCGRLSANPRKKKKGKQPTKCIHLYKLTSGKYEPSASIARSYGFTNLYRDAANTANVNHIEEKFAKLECAAAGVIHTLKHKVSSGDLSVNLMRKDLHVLQKFLFLLHLRSQAISKTYKFHGHHPHPASIREWIHRQMVLQNVSSDTVPLWLHALDYYLDSPIDRILLDSQAKDSELVSQMNANPSIHGSSSDPDTDVKHWHAQTYELFHNWYYLAICEAAPGKEFVLGHNSFGIWEGTLAEGDGGVHHLYILSPRIVIILKLDMTKNAMFDMMMVDSILNDVPFTPPVIHFTGPPSPSPKDTFAFRVHRLTESQTYRVNEIVLENVHAEGTLTFASEEVMLALLDEYDSPHGSFSKPHRAVLRKLKDALSQRLQSRGPLDSNSRSSGSVSPVPAMQKVEPSKVSLDASYHPTVTTAEIGPSSGSSPPPVQRSEQIDTWITEELPPEISSRARSPRGIAFDSVYDREYVNRFNPSPSTAFYISPVPIVEPETTFLHGDLSDSRGKPTSLPLSRIDNAFDVIFSESFASWERAGKKVDPALLRRVYVAIGTSDEDNHPIALKIRCMISDAIRRRMIIGTAKDVHLHPWVVPKVELDDFLTEIEFITVFNIAITMGLQDDLFKPVGAQDSRRSPSAQLMLTFIQQVAVYGYLRDWLYRHELIRLATVTALGVPAFVKKLRDNTEFPSYL